LVREFDAAGVGLYAVAADRRGTRVAAAGAGGTVRVWDAATGEPVATFRATPGLAR
jgi:hypothetical protein